MFYQDLRQRADEVLARVQQVEDPVVRRDLKIMHGVLEKLLNELDQETVNCRRLKHTTLTYQERERRALEHLEIVEKNLTFAQLL